MPAASCRKRRRETRLSMNDSSFGSVGDAHPRRASKLLDPRPHGFGTGDDLVEHRVERPEPLANVVGNRAAADRRKGADSLVIHLGERRIAERLAYGRKDEEAIELLREVRMPLARGAQELIEIGME